MPLLSHCVLMPVTFFIPVYETKGRMCKTNTDLRTKAEVLLLAVILCKGHKEATGTTPSLCCLHFNKSENIKALCSTNTQLTKIRRHLSFGV